MIVELLPYNKQAYYLDPRRKNVQYIGKGGSWDSITITSYEDLVEKVFSNNSSALNNSEDLCFDSRNTSERIYKALLA